MDTIVPALREVAQTVAMASDDDMEEFARLLTPEQVIAWLARAETHGERLEAFRKTLRERLVEPEVRAAIANGWKDPDTGRWWGIRIKSRRAFTDIIGLWSELEKYGIGLRQFMGAVSEVRVTDLQAAARTLPPDVTKRVFETLDQFRPEKDSPPRFTRLDERE